MDPKFWPAHAKADTERGPWYVRDGVIHAYTCVATGNGSGILLDTGEVLLDSELNNAALFAKRPSAERYATGA